MDVYKAARSRKMDTIARVSRSFRQIFGRGIEGYFESTSSGLIWFDFTRLFGELGVPLDSSSQEVMRRKYGPEAVELIGELIP